jgi:hypothetical protein
LNEDQRRQEERQGGGHSHEGELPPVPGTVWPHGLLLVEWSVHDEEHDLLLPTGSLAQQCGGQVQDGQAHAEAAQRGHHAEDPEAGC